jgi:hypothetical protein
LRADLREFFEMVFQKLLQLEEILNALLGRTRPNFSPVAGLVMSEYSPASDARQRPA